jgi:hypothetical protein
MKMKSENNRYIPDEKDSLHIGSRIKEKFLESRLSIEQFANLISCKSGNIYKIFERERIDTGLLKKICIILNYNFFDLYSKELQLDETDKVQISFKLCVPLKDWREGNICQYCEINKKKKQDE